MISKPIIKSASVGMSILADLSVAMATHAPPVTGQYTPWSQPPKGPRNKPGNSLAKARAKAKARRKAKQAARRSA